MSELTHVFREVGVWAYLMLALCLLGLALTALFTALSLARKRVPAPLWWLVPALLLSLGWFSTAVGTLEVKKVLSALDTPDLRLVFLLSGEATSRQGVALGMGMSALLLTLGTLGASLGPGLRPPTPRRRTLLQAGWVAGWTVLALGAGMAWTMLTRIGFSWTMGVALIGGLAMTLSAARLPESPRPQQAQVASRALVASLWLSASLLATWAQNQWSQVDTLMALRSAAPDTYFLLSILGLRHAQWSISSGMTVTALLAVAAALPVLRQLKALLHKRALLGAAITVILLGLPTLATVSGAYLLYALHQEAEEIGFTLERAVQRHKLEPPGPIPGGPGADAFFYKDCFLARQGKGWVLDPAFQPNPACPAVGTPAQLPLEDAQDFLLLLHGDDAASTLARPNWYKDTGQLNLLLTLYFPPGQLDVEPPVTLRVQQHRRMPLVWLATQGEPPTLNWQAFVVEGPKGGLWWVEKGKTRRLGDIPTEPLSWDDPRYEALNQEINALRLPRVDEPVATDTLPANFPALVFMVGPKTPLHAVTQLCLAARLKASDSDLRCVLAQEPASDWLQRQKVELR